MSEGAMPTFDGLGMATHPRSLESAGPTPRFHRRPSISVIVPTYDRLALLARALESIFDQTIAPDEVIVVDDGSTDGTAQWLETIAARHACVRCIRQQRRGPGAARNRGIAAANGEWIAFLDSDDTWEPAKLEHAIALLRSDPEIDFVHSNFRYREPDGRERESWNDRHDADLTDRELLLAHFLIKAPTVVVRRSLLDRLGGLFPETVRTCEDYDLWWRALVSARRIGYVATPDVVVYVSPGSLTEIAGPAALLRDNIVVRAHLRRWLLAREDMGRFADIVRRDLYWDYRQLARMWLRERNLRELFRDVRDCVHNLALRDATRMVASAWFANLRKLPGGPPTARGLAWARQPHLRRHSMPLIKR